MTEKILLNTPLYTFCRQLDTANITDLSLFTPDTKQVWLDKIALLRKQTTALIEHFSNQFKADEIDAENWLVQHYRSL
jgi:hypothetical protein